MDAEYFYLHYIDAMKEDNVCSKTGQTYFEMYKDYSVFTELVNKEVVHNIIVNASEGLTVQHEYFRIDTVGWKSSYKDIEKEAAALEFQPHLWDLKIAVEHENNSSDWNDEIIKLIHIKCPLKVIIGYNGYNSRDDMEMRKLQFIADCMRRVAAFKNGADEEYLIIIGNAYDRVTKDSCYDGFGYKGYILNNKEMKFNNICIR